MTSAIVHYISTVAVGFTLALLPVWSLLAGPCCCQSGCGERVEVANVPCCAQSEHPSDATGETLPSCECPGGCQGESDVREGSALVVVTSRRTLSAQAGSTGAPRSRRTRLKSYSGSETEPVPASGWRCYLRLGRLLL